MFLSAQQLGFGPPIHAATMMVNMLGYAVDVEDIARVTAGITLGLLTVYRRELSSNRAYHDEQAAEVEGDVMPEESDDWSRAPSDSEGNPEETPAIPRRKSLSALHGEEPPMITDEQLQSKATRRDAIDRARRSDHLDELLDSAGTVFSGGPFLAVGTAVLDHIVFNSLAGAYAGMASSLRHSFARRVSPLDEVDTPKNPEGKQSPGSSTVGPIHNQFIYNVAWNAASDYFSSKLESASGSSGDDYDDKSQRDLSMRKSKSTSNLIPLSDMQTRELLYDMIDMAGRGNMDINLLPSEQQIHVFSYLSPADLLAFTCTNSAARRLLTEAAPIEEDEVEMSSVDPAEEGAYRSSGNTAILIWKALFQRDFAWILSDWQIGREALVRSLRIGCDRPPRRSGDSTRSEVLRHVLSAVVESGNDELRSVDVDSVGSTFPLSAMKDFYFIFAETWLNYTIAGCNSTEKCLIGLHGHVFDISDFVEAHPGSTETLLIQSGRDSTVSFFSGGLYLLEQKS